MISQNISFKSSFITRSTGSRQGSGNNDVKLQTIRLANTLKDHGVPCKVTMKPGGVSFIEVPQQYMSNAQRIIGRKSPNVTHTVASPVNPDIS